MRWKGFKHGPLKAKGAQNLRHGAGQAGVPALRRVVDQEMPGDCGQGHNRCRIMLSPSVSPGVRLGICASDNFQRMDRCIFQQFAKLRVNAGIPARSSARIPAQYPGSVSNRDAVSGIREYPETLRAAYGHIFHRDTHRLHNILRAWALLLQLGYLVPSPVSQYALLPIERRK